MITNNIAQAGTSIWLDDLSRSRITGTDPLSLPSRIKNSGVVGVTTNPSIFNSAITGSSDYASDIAQMKSLSPEEIVKKLTTDDVRRACDVFTEIYSRTSGVDGRVSIEVDPRLAHETSATIEEGKSLWSLVDRPNLMIKVPATLAGLPAITELIASGISVNVTLIFSCQRYEQVIEAFITGIEEARKRGQNLSNIHSVASFFISRIDTAVDQQLKQINTPASLNLLGKSAIANAVIAYELFLMKSTTQRWKELRDLGAQMQRPLWASTGVKDPSYDDTRYVIELVAPHTVNTMPQSTLDAVIDHGKFRGDTVTPAIEDSHATLEQLSQIGISLNLITERLETDGVAAFAKAWQALLDDVEKVRSA
ncbi:MAG: transaldolase [Candidatus Planktophila sp.]